VIRADSILHASRDKLANLNATTEPTEQELEELSQVAKDLQKKQERNNRASERLKRLDPQPDNTSLSPSISTTSTLTPVTPRSRSPDRLKPRDSPPQKATMAPTTEDKLFRGDYSAGEKPHIWFRRLEGKFDDETKLTTKLYRFAKNLEPGRPAEIWYRALPDHEKEDWEELYQAFTKRWPLPAIVEPSREELLEKLSQTKLASEDVGVMTERDGDRVYSHIVWAEEVKALVDVLDDVKGHLIPQVRRNLPLAIRLTLPSNLNDWDTFLKAVRSLSMDRLADQRENTEVIRDNILQTMGVGNQQQYNINTMTTKLAATSFYPSARPIPAYTHKTPATQMNQMTSTPPTPNTVRQQWNMRTPSTPMNQRFNQPIVTPSGSFLSTNSTLHPNSIFANQKTATPVPQTPSPNHTQLTNQDLARKAIAASSTFPNTPEGKANYQAALQAWEAVYPPAREVDFTTAPYPLTPGTAPLGSRECYTCGLQGHINRDHDPAIPAINLREQRWRAFVGRNLQARARMDFTPVAQINAQDEDTLPYDPAIYNAAQLDFFDDYVDQGNGEEVHE
jgi:hypothetical protein